jgi:hypothetical protein
MAKQKKSKEGKVGVKFTVPAFRYKGVEYKSAAVEKAVIDGDEDAQALVANLVKIGSGVVEVSDVPQKEEGGTE